MDQIDRILDKAQKLGLNAGDNLESIAKEIGFKTFDSEKDLNKIETKLDNLMYEQNKNREIINDNVDTENNIENLYQDNDINDSYIDNVNENNNDIPKDNPKEIEKEGKKETRKELDEGLGKIEEEALKHFGVPEYFAKKAGKKKAHGVGNFTRNKLADGIYNIKNKFGDDKNNQNNDKKSQEDKENKEENNKKIPKVIPNKDNVKSITKEKSGELILSFIKKNPMILLFIGVFIVIFLIIIIIMSTGDYSGNNPLLTCDTIPMNGTSLTKDEFIEKVTASLSSSANPGAAIFIENAGLIYDKSVENSVNPEIVILRSRREGFSPSGSRKVLSDNPNLASYNNYYGMGCNNTGGLANCTNYEDFEEGLLDFLSFVKEYSNINDMMAKYSSLGSYWYNTEDNSQNTGLGGCYYLEYIKPFLPEDRISVAESACREGNYCYRNGSGNCVKTTEEDRKAYTQYQVQEMSKDRTMIFGLEPEVCYNFAEGCVIYGQSDPKWADKYLGHSNADMGHYGCAVTSIAIGIRCSGVEVTIPDFDAGTFLDALNEGNCFDASGSIASWDCPAINKVAPSVKYLTQENGLLSKSDEEVIALINQYDPNTTFIVLHFNHEDRDGGHFIVYSGINGEYFLVKDPAQGGIQNNIKISKIDRFIVYSTNYGV